MLADAMWESAVETLHRNRIQRFRILERGKRLSCLEVMRLWREDMAFRTFFNSLLADAPHTAYFWETPPVTAASAEQAFEFVLVDSGGLASVKPDPEAFRQYFDSASGDEEVVAFANLGGDAYLIAPCPRASLSVYAHLAAFVRQAPERQKHALWRCIGETLERRLDARPIWLSTAGLGVYWLHVRLDSRPKYYSFQPYRQPPEPRLSARA
jgi:hypothetical protein